MPNESEDRERHDRNAEDRERHGRNDRHQSDLASSISMLAKSVEKLFDLSDQTNKTINAMHTDSSLLADQVKRLATAIEGNGNSQPIGTQLALLRNDTAGNDKRLCELEKSNSNRNLQLIGILATAVVSLVITIIQSLLKGIHGP